jgi:hypothetical protein
MPGDRANLRRRARRSYPRRQPYRASLPARARRIADGPLASNLGDIGASLRHVKQSDEGAINQDRTMNHFSITYRIAGPPPGRWKAVVSSTEVWALFAPSGAAPRFRAAPRPTRGRAKANLGLPCATSLAYYCVAAWIVLLMRAIEPDPEGAAAMQQVAEWLEKLGRLRRGSARCRSRFQGTLNRRRKGRILGGRGRQPCTRAKD